MWSGTLGKDVKRKPGIYPHGKKSLQGFSMQGFFPMGKKIMNCMKYSQMSLSDYKIKACFVPRRSNRFQKKIPTRICNEKSPAGKHETLLLLVNVYFYMPLATLMR